MTGAVLIVGGGISGMQSALDLAESGFKVYIVEKTAAIGGKMPMLDKTFPTNDCSMCILSPKLVECGRHRNIEVLTLSEVTDLQGEAGNFSVTVKKNPRYVDTDKCLSCGSCTEECPQDMPDEFNQGIGTRKAIYKLYPQAFPNAYLIDKESCLECGGCEDACPVGAINYDMEEEEIVLNVGAVILCPGYELFDAELRGEFGYGVYENVMTSLQFERMLSASGPHHGHVIRPFDGKEPKKIAFIQCVGSRDIAKGRGYCSSVCCMYATKEAMIAREHVPGLNSTIFCIDVRAFGKDFEKYYNRAQNDYDVKYVKCMISSVKEMPQTKDLRLRYRTPDGAITDEDFDMVVLSVGLMPTSDAINLSKVLDFPLNEYSFCKLKEFSGVQSLKEGIYVAGCFSGPKDIPETVMQASAAAGDSASFLAPVRNTLVTDRVFPKEANVNGQEPRIGVFVCHCGINIGSVVNVPEVVEYAKKLPNVVHAQEGLYVCSQDSQSTIKELIKEHDLNRIVVASCSPRTHKPLFQETVREVGLNKQLFEMANIRDQCAWVHQKEPLKATDKSKDLVKMAITKAGTQNAVQPVIVSVTSSALIIGGGIAGMNAALCLADQGYEVHLVEKGQQLGGIARRIGQGFNNEDIKSYLKELSQGVLQHHKINIYTGCQISGFSGYMGNFNSKLNDGRQIKHGVTILATGGAEYKPEEYLYGNNSRVVTQLELDEALDNDDSRVQKAKNIVFIQCVGSREENRPYCSRICCTKTVKMAVRLKNLNPKLNIFVLYRDMRTYGFNEDHYRAARSLGVIFIRYELEEKPLVEHCSGGEPIKVSIYDAMAAEKLEVKSDLLVLAAATVAAPTNHDLSQLFRIPLNQDDFFLEAHMKLRPVDLASEGVYMCGLAHGPKSIEESISQGKAAASRAASILGRKTLESKGLTARVEPTKCAACLTCVRLCPYNAPRIKDNVAIIEAVICQGCGSCAGECPNKAITLEGYRDDQYISMLDELFN